MRELNLTEEQRAQHREIMERHAAVTKAQREELVQLRQKRASGALTPDDEARAQALRQELQTSMESMRAEFANTLTPEQRAKLAELQNERKSRFEERKKRRGTSNPDPEQ
jgi:Spy/CpxP family protein refolding chaperone